MPNLLLSGRAQQLHGPLPLCCCQRFPGPSRNSLLEKGRQSPKEVSPLFVFDERSPKAFSPYPAASPSLRRAFPLVVWEAFPYLNVGRHSFIPLWGPRGCFGLNIGSNMIGGVLATPCVQYKKSLWEADDKKRFLCCTEKRT